MSAEPAPIPPELLTVDFRIPDDGTPTLLCSGRMTSETSGRLRSEVKRLSPHSKLIVVDLSRVRFMDSSGLATLLSAYVSAKSAGCDLKLINLSRCIKDLLRLTRLATLFDSSG